MERRRRKGRRDTLGHTQTPGVPMHHLLLPSLPASSVSLIHVYLVHDMTLTTLLEKLLPELNILYFYCIPPPPLPVCVEGRKLMDVQTKQQMNIEQQRFTASEAEHVHLDMLGRQIETRIQVTDLNNPLWSSMVVA